MFASSKGDTNTAALTPEMRVKCIGPRIYYLECKSGVCYDFYILAANHEQQETARVSVHGTRCAIAVLITIPSGKFVRSIVLK